MEDVEWHSPPYDFLAVYELCVWDAPFCPWGFFFLGAFVGPSCSTFSLLHFALHQVMVKDALCGHAGKQPAYVTHDCHPIMYLSEVDDNCFGIPPSLRHQGQNDFNSTLVETLRAPESIVQMKSLQVNHGTRSCPSRTASRNMHGTALMNAQRSSSSLGPLPQIHLGGFSCAFFDLEQLVSPDCLVYFKGVAIFLESELPLCIDSFIVALPYSLVTITNPFQLGLQPEATP